MEKTNEISLKDCRAYHVDPEFLKQYWELWYKHLRLVENPCDPMTREVTPLMKAAYIGDMAMVKWFLALGCDVNRSCGAAPERMEEGERGPFICGDTALHAAALAGNREIYAFLLGKGAQEDRLNSEGKKAVSYLEAEGKADAKAVESYRQDLRKLKESMGKPGSPYETYSHFGDTPLMMAAFLGDMDAVRFLVSKGVAVNQTNIRKQGEDGNASPTSGQTALHYAAIGGHRDVYDYLLRHGATPHVRGADGRIPRQLWEDLPSGPFWGEGWEISRKGTLIRNENSCK